jgi:hypothetical protein
MRCSYGHVEYGSVEGEYDLVEVRVGGHDFHHKLIKGNALPSCVTLMSLAVMDSQAQNCQVSHAFGQPKGKEGDIRILQVARHLGSFLGHSV